jgi:hypothetical protein
VIVRRLSMLGYSAVRRGFERDMRSAQNGLRLMRASRASHAPIPLAASDACGYLRTIITSVTGSTMRRNLLAFALVFAAVPALADDASFALTLKDHQFTPSELSVPAGVRIKLQVTNQEQRSAEFESTAMHFEKIVGSGRAIDVFVGPLDPGTYEFYNDFDQVARGHVIAK